MAYRIAAIPMTLSDLQGHLPIPSLLKCNILYSDKISTDSTLIGLSVTAYLLFASND